MTVAVVNFEKLLKNLEKLPWRSIYIVVSVSFIVATLASNLVSMQLMPDLSIGGARLASNSTVEEVLPTRAALTDADLNKIYDRNIFNRDGELGDREGSGEEGGATEEIRKSDLPLKVLGIIYGGTPYNGLATIENTQNSKINSFIVGDALIKDAQIYEIHQTKVFIQRSNRKEFLELEQAEIVRDSRRKKKDVPPSANGFSPIAKGPPPKIFREEGFAREGNEMVMSSDYKQNLLTQDFTKVLQDAKAVPNIVDGQTKGFKLERIRENSIYQKAGLQNGDVVEEINGVPLTDAGNTIKLLQSLRTANEVEVMVNRSGSVFPMKLSVK